MYWIKETFIPYCTKQGYQLIKDDYAFIEKRLSLLPSHLRKPVLYEYCKAWQEAMDSVLDINKRQSYGRRAANVYLLKKTGGK